MCKKLLIDNNRKFRVNSVDEATPFDRHNTSEGDYDAVRRVKQNESNERNMIECVNNIPCNFQSSIFLN